MTAVNSNAACWGDYDNDGWLDLFIGCERQPNRLYHNRRDGTFEEVAAKAGVQGDDQPLVQGCQLDRLRQRRLPGPVPQQSDGRGPALSQQPRRHLHRRHGSPWASTGPTPAFRAGRGTTTTTAGSTSTPPVTTDHSRTWSRACWACRTTAYPTSSSITWKVGVSRIGPRKRAWTSSSPPWGATIGDFDNDGFLDMYLGTGDLDLATLVPNRMLKNVDGQRFADITASSGTGNLQKGHGVACGDWDRDGDVDVFIQMGGAVNGDKYHNILFQNPGQGNHWLTVKLIGKKTNRPAIGARIKVVTAGEKPLTIHRHVSSGSSFGANPLEQTIGLARADRVAVLEIHGPRAGRPRSFTTSPRTRPSR